MSALFSDTPMAFLLGLAVLGLVLGLGLAVLYARRSAHAASRARDAEVEAETMRTALADGPDGLFRWDMTGATVQTDCSARLAVLLNLKNGRAATIDEIVSSFEGDDRDSLDQAVIALRDLGRGFELVLRRSNGRDARLIHAIGRRITGPDGTPIFDSIWMRDVSALNEARERKTILPAGGEGAMIRILMNALPFPVWLRSSDGAVAFVNRAADALHPQNHTSAMAAHALETEIAVTERHLMTGGESTRLLEVTEAPLPGNGTIGYAIDKSSAEEMESEFARHVAAHEQVLEQLTTAIAIYGEDKHLQFHNTAFATLWGLEPAWLAGEPSLSTVLDRLRTNRRLPEFADYRAFREQQMAQFGTLEGAVETMLHLPDGTTIRSLISPHPLGGLIMAYENVTDRLALERSYNTLTAVQRETLDNLYEGVAVFGADGRLKLHNPAFARLWKLKEADLAGEPHVSAFAEKMRPFLIANGADEADWPKRKEHLVAQLMKREARTGRITRTDGTVLEFAGVPLPDGGVLLSYIDVTDSERAEQALRERAEGLSEAMRLRAEFISSVNYEIRTPLNTISGFADILAGEHFGKLNPRQMEYATGIVESSRTLMQVVSDILDFAAIEAGTMALELDTVDVHSTLAGALVLIRETARRKNLKVDFDCSPEIGWVVADEKRLKQIVFNLLNNAVNATATPGSVTLSAARDGADLVVAVSDTGNRKQAKPTPQIGMFEGMDPTFHEAPDDRTDSGLGLSLVKKFVEMHGGDLDIKARPKRGTTITCRLPARDGSEGDDTGTVVHVHTARR